MKTSQNGIDLIKSFEGFEEAPYKCSAGVWTIGYGTTIYPNGIKVAETDPEITRGQAEGFLKAALDKFERSVLKLVVVELSQNQFDAVVSFTYNLGAGALSTSTLLKLLNKGWYSQAAEEFPKWNKAGGKVSAGLIKRRDAEKALFLKEY
jgi:lysozyme